MKYTLVINGGIGKHICATTMLRFIKEQEPDARLTVISGYPEVFLFNPRIYRNLHHMTSYVFDDYICGTDFRAGDPYMLKEYFMDEKHMSAVYPLAYRFNNMNTDIYPELFLNEEETLKAQQFISQARGPIITVQVTGGNQMMNPCKDPRILTPRDMKQDAAQKIVDLCNARGFSVFQVALPQEYKLRNVLCFNNLPFRAYMAMIPQIAGHIGIDSAMMHAVAAFRKPGLIFWNNTRLNNLGYPHMANVFKMSCKSPMCSRPHVGMPDTAPEGGWQCPEGLACTKWSTEEITEKVNIFLDNVQEEVKNVQSKSIRKIPLGKSCGGCDPRETGAQATE